MKKETKKNKKVVIGGTFGILHKGHEKLLRKAFGLGEVFIGLTSDTMARKMKKRKVQGFKYRKKELRGFIKKKFKAEPRIAKIEDKRSLWYNIGGLLQQSSSSGAHNTIYTYISKVLNNPQNISE